ncbi:MAG: hypothetical protein JSR46_06600, partial [Verrucomicrobia bacterium]|nr:hypothetical protein [Verrucomicrobiota bacterium]
MSGLFDLPDETVHQAYELYTKFADTKKKPCKVSDVFCVVKDDNSIDIIAKDSSEGRWLAFKAMVRHHFGFESELSKGKKVIQGLVRQQALFTQGSFVEKRIEKEQAGKDPAEIAEALLKMIAELATLEKVVDVKPFSSPVIPSTMNKKVGEAAKKALFADEAALKAKATVALTKVLPHQSVEHIASFLTRYEETPQLLEDLSHMETNPSQAIASLRVALMKGITYADQKGFKEFET